MSSDNVNDARIFRFVDALSDEREVAFLIYQHPVLFFIKLFTTLL